MRILILGASGMLGHTLYENFVNNSSFDVYGSLRNEKLLPLFNQKLKQNLISNIDASNFEELIKLIDKLKPEVIINCIGVIKQKSAKNSLIQMNLINKELPKFLGNLSKTKKFRLIHISTDCVFSGESGNYSEDNIADAIDNYGKSKLAGEIINLENVLTLRTSIVGHELNSCYSLIDWFLSQRNTVEGYTNAIFSGLTTIKFYEILFKYVIKNPDIYGLYHVGGFTIDKYSLLSIVSKIYKKSIKIIPSDKIKIDRSLNSTMFMKKTGYEKETWRKMIKNLYSYYQER